MRFLYFVKKTLSLALLLHLASCSPDDSNNKIPTTILNSQKTSNVTQEPKHEQKLEEVKEWCTRENTNDGTPETCTCGVERPQWVAEQAENRGHRASISVSRDSDGYIIRVLVKDFFMPNNGDMLSGFANQHVYYPSLTACKGLNDIGEKSSAPQPQEANQTNNITPSFDCNKAKSYSEILVCSNTELSYKDNLIAALYRNFLVGDSKIENQNHQIKQSQIFWIKSRNKCNNQNCVGDTYNSRISELKSQIAYKPTNETKKVLGACFLDKIKSIEPRLNNGSFDSGVFSDYESGTRAVSYDAQSEVIKSRPGDNIIVCLKSLPDNCPVGDERGAVYFTHNLRTGENWVLPADSHSCGGT